MPMQPARGVGWVGVVSAVSPNLKVAHVDLSADRIKQLPKVLAFRPGRPVGRCRVAVSVESNHDHAPGDKLRAELSRIGDCCSALHSDTRPASAALWSRRIWSIAHSVRLMGGSLSAASSRCSPRAAWAGSGRCRVGQSPFVERCTRSASEHQSRSSSNDSAANLSERPTTALSSGATHESK